MRGLIATVLLCAACQVAAADPVEVDTAPAGERRASAGAGTEGAADTAVAMAAGLAAFDDDALLADPSSLSLTELGYDHEPSALGEHAARWHGVGLDALRDGDLERAVAAFAIVVDDAPDHATAIFNLANALAQSGDLDRAARALARALTLEYPHLWRAYQERPDFAPVRNSAQHERLEALAAHLRGLHSSARSQGQSHTARFDRNRSARWAQAGVRVGGRFVPLAPRVWASTALDHNEQRVEAVYDPGHDLVLNIVARGGRASSRVAVEVHDPIHGRRLARNSVERGTVLHIEPSPHGARLSNDEQAWTDLRGRPIERPEQVSSVHLRIDAQGIERL